MTTPKAEEVKVEEKPAVEVKPVIEAKVEKPIKPKRKCSEKQLAALAEGRKRNPRWIAKQERLKKEADEKEKISK
jgi:hypothetical protein